MGDTLDKNIIEFMQATHDYFNKWFPKVLATELQWHDIDSMTNEEIVNRWIDQGLSLVHADDYEYDVMKNGQYLFSIVIAPTVKRKALNPLLGGALIP